MVDPVMVNFSPEYLSLIGLIAMKSVLDGMMLTVATVVGTVVGTVV